MKILIYLDNFEEFIYDTYMEKLDYNKVIENVVKIINKNIELKKNLWTYIIMKIKKLKTIENQYF